MADATVYDVSIGSHNFFMASTPERPYIRQTAPYRKDQNDNSAEPGEQTLQGWWYRSQSSFHLGAGIKYYEPNQDETLRYRFAMSDGVDVWTKGQVSLLNSTGKGHTITGGVGQSTTRMRTVYPGGTGCVLALDGQDVDKIAVDGSVTHFVDFNNGTAEPVLAICDDGQYAYFVCNQASPSKWHIFRKPLTGNSTTGTTTPSGDVTQLHQATTNASSAEIEWVFGRLILAVRTSTGTEIFQGAVDTAAGTITLTSIYQYKGSNVFNCITASQSHIYLSSNPAYGGGGEIVRIAVDSTGAIPALSGIVVAAKLPSDELINTIRYYSGFLLIGTNRGVRIAQVSSTGDVVYGPNFLEDAFYGSHLGAYNQIYAFAPSGSFVYAAGFVPVLNDSTGQSVLQVAPGLWKIDLSTQIEPLRFPYASDLRSTVTSSGSYYATGVAVVQTTSGNKVLFASYEPTTGGIGGFYYENVSSKVASGCIVTGRIRFNTLEKKIFRSITDRAEYVTGSTLDIDEIQYSSKLATYSARVEGLTLTPSTGNTENVLPTSTAVEWKQYRLTLTRGTSDVTTGTVLNGYQLKALPSSPRQRLIQYPLYCFDNEIDKYNIAYGYDGKAYATLTALEATEGTGAIVTVTDRRTGETFPGMIEEVTFKSETPPDKRFNGFGGILTVTVRKI